MLSGHLVPLYLVTRLSDGILSLNSVKKTTGIIRTVIVEASGLSFISILMLYPIFAMKFYIIHSNRCYCMLVEVHS